MGRILAIDYGRKKIGLAITDESQIIISNLPQIPNDPLLWKTMAVLLSQYSPESIVLGYPSSTMENLTNVQKEILAFKNKISTMGNFQIFLLDESYTSEEAGKIYIQNRGGKKTSHKKMKERKQKIDSLAAHLLLRTFLKFPVE